MLQTALRQFPNLSEAHRRRLVRTGCALVVAGALGLGTDAHAADSNPPRPNVLLVIDNSNSMQFRLTDDIDNMDSAAQEAAQNQIACVFGGSGSTPTRWSTLLETMTGHFVPYYSCERLDRSPLSVSNPFGDSAYSGRRIDYFKNRSIADGNQPLDFYSIKNTPYRRPSSGGDRKCLLRNSATAPTANEDFALSGTGAHIYSYCETANTTDKDDFNANFPQLTDGVLDNYSQYFRFGLMTFDTYRVYKESNIRAFPFAYPTPDVNNTNLNNGADNLGARGLAAPPWEGRMISFDPIGSTNLSPEDFTRENNERVQRVLLASRTFDGTPLRKMMEDVTHYLKVDEKGPKIGTTASATDIDPYRTCRQTSIVLLTDGFPNMDYVSGGTTGTEVTPAVATSNVAALVTSLKNDGVNTYVIGYSKSATTAKDFLDSTATAGGKDNLPGCSGAHGKYCYAPSAEGLRAAFSAIVADMLPAGSRATPVAGLNRKFGAEATLDNSVFELYFKPQLGFAGQLYRRPLNCDGAYKSTAPEILSTPPTPSSPTDTSRHFLTTFPDATTCNTTVSGSTPDAALNCAREIFRPRLATSQGGDQNAAPIEIPWNGLNNGQGALAASVPKIKKLMDSGSLTCNQRNGDVIYDNAPGALHPICLWRFLDRALQTRLRGDYNSGPDGFTTADDPVLVKASQNENGLGPVFRARPVVFAVGQGTTADPTYSRYVDYVRNGYPIQGVGAYPAGVNIPPTAIPHQILYLQTNDGVLHAVDADEKADGSPAKSTDEMWSFLVPATIHRLGEAYSSGEQILDGSVVVRDLIVDRDPAAPRTLNTTGTIDLETQDWRTILVGSLGSLGGYYAMDVSYPKKPKFLWHMTGNRLNTLNAGVSSSNETTRLFGRAVSDAALTTVSYRAPSSTTTKLVGVAILPGGASDIIEGTCSRLGGAAPSASNGLPSNTTVSPARSVVRHYRRRPGRADSAGSCAHAVTGRSLYVVRVDTGEVLAAFGRAAPGSATHTWDVPSVPMVTANKIYHTPFDAPITGTPTVYPGTIGAVAKQAYVADAEGTIWRMDFSKPDPETWKPEIFFDPYGVDDTLNVGSPTAANMKLMSSESVYPISISINGKNGTTVINGATGSGADVSVNKNNIVYSISESFESASGSTTGKMRAKLNWSQKLVGRHVTGGVNVYSGNLIYTTYDAPKAGALGVSTGCDSDTRPRFYARDFVTAKDSLFPKSDGKFTNPFPAGTLTSNNSGEFFTLTDTTKRGVLPGLLLAANQCSETTSTNVDDPITGNQLFLTKTTRSTTMSLYSSQGSANTSSSTPNPVRQSTNLSQPAAYSESWVPFAE